MKNDMHPRFLKTLLLTLAVFVVTTAGFGAETSETNAAVAATTPETQSSETNAPPTPTPAMMDLAFPKKEEPLALKMMGISVGLVAVIMGCGIPLLAIWTDYRKKRELLQACHEERMAALEKGLDVPAFPRGLFGDEDEATAESKPGDGLKSGLVWLALGIGMAIWLGTQARPTFHPGISGIPLALGLAYLVYYAVKGRQVKAGGDPGRNRDV
jgi:hypothetical protein